MEHGIGTYLPEKGMHEITSSLVQLAEDLGVVFHLNERVEEILLQNQKVTGVRSSKKVYQADLVVSNMDVTPTYRKLLPHVKAPEKN